MPSFGELLSLLSAEHERVAQEATRLARELSTLRLSSKEPRHRTRSTDRHGPLVPAPPGVSPQALEAKPVPEPLAELYTNGAEGPSLHHEADDFGPSSSIKDAVRMLTHGNRLGIFPSEGSHSESKKGSWSSPRRGREPRVSESSSQAAQRRTLSKTSEHTDHHQFQLHEQEIMPCRPPMASEEDGSQPRAPSTGNEGSNSRSPSRQASFGHNHGEHAVHKEWSMGTMSSPMRTPRRPFNANGIKVHLDDMKRSASLGSAGLAALATTSMVTESPSKRRAVVSEDVTVDEQPADDGFASEGSDPGRGSNASKFSKFSWKSEARSEYSNRARRSSILGMGAQTLWIKIKAENRDTVASPWLINPEQSHFLEKWDMVTMSGLAFVALIAPVQVSMLETKWDFMFFLNCCIDFIFVVDLVLQFFMMYQVKTDYGFEWEHRHARIIRHYLKTWFVVDVISIIPFDLMTLLLKAKELENIKVVKVVRLMRLLKLVRVLKSSRVFRRFEVRMSITYASLALLRFFVILAVITHWLANMWALTLVLVEESEGIPRWVDVFAERERHITEKTKDTPWKLYLTCVYFTSYTITSVGYGDIGPANTVEMIISTVMIVVSGLSWAVVLGQVCGVLANFNTDEQVFRSTMDELNLMMRDRSMPMDMRRRLRSFFLSNKTAQRRQRHQKIIQALSPGLRGEVIMMINRLWINKVGLFANILKEGDSAENIHPTQVSPFYSFMVELVQSLSRAFYAQSETFGKQHVLYILNRGLVGRNIRLHQAGSVWGVDFVLTDAKLLEPTRAFTFTYVELTTLRREDFMKLLEQYSSTCPDLKRRVRRFCCWLAFQRAFMREAKKRQQKLAGMTCAASMVSVVSRPKAVADKWDPGEWHSAKSQQQYAV